MSKVFAAPVEITSVAELRLLCQLLRQALKAAGRAYPVHLIFIAGKLILDAKLLHQAEPLLSLTFGTTFVGELPSVVCLTEENDPAWYSQVETHLDDDDGILIPQPLSAKDFQRVVRIAWEWLDTLETDGC
ncbi:MAG TPA: hypothetical protein VFW33_05570, partial [Gemmataceae bacterium]|nr:hypothetical protein [Gemmataceae bacterium]